MAVVDVSTGRVVTTLQIGSGVDAIPRPRPSLVPGSFVVLVVGK